MSRFVRPETTLLTLASGESLTVKKRLTSGEQRAMFARMYIAGVDGRLTVNPLEVGMALITAYLVDWSFDDDDHRPVRIRGISVDELTAILDNLEPDAFAEIRAAIEDHEVAMAQEREAAKKKTAGETPSDPISPSPSAAAGPSTRSAALM